jgi:hypothetical protein
MNTLIMTLTILLAMTGLNHAGMPAEPAQNSKEMVVEPVPGDAGTDKQGNVKLKKAKIVKGKKSKRNDEILMPVEPPAENVQRNEPASK